MLGKGEKRMAYLDPQHTHKRLVGATGVALVHIALALGLAAGLTIKYVEPPKPEIFTGVTVAPPPPPPPDPAPDPEPVVERTRVVQPQPVPDPVFNLGQLPPSQLTEDFLPFEPTFGPVELVAAVGPVTPPALAPRAPVPNNGPTGWVTNNDYPQVALRRGWEGDLTYALDVGADGRVDDCRIINSSGRSVLDDAACRMITRRARFDPATNSSGDTVGGTYRGAVSWMIP
jgi:protein TonB